MQLVSPYASRRTPPREPMQREPLPQRWHERLRLSDGRELMVRPILPVDAEPLRVGFALLTPEEVRLRFLHPLKELSPDLLHRLTHLEPH